MNDLYPSPLMKALQNILHYDDYLVEDTPTDAQIQDLQLDESPDEDSLNPEIFTQGIEEIIGKLPFNEPFGYEQYGAKIILTFGNVPSLTFILAIFSLLSSRGNELGVKGIHKLILNAGRDNEIVHNNVTCISQPHQTSIPLILQEVQLHHLLQVVIGRAV